MYKLLKTSLLIPFRKFPKRSELKSAAPADVIVLYVLSLGLGLISIYATPSDLTDPGNSLGHQLVIAVGSDVAWLAIATVLGRIVINKYAKVKFSLQEMLAFFVVLTSGISIISTVIFIPTTILGETGMLISGFVSIVLGIYMLFVYRDAISVVGSISKDQAVHVMIAPFIALLVFWVLMFFVSLVLAPAV